MIRFDNWHIYSDGEIFARQFDNLTRDLTVTGDIPDDWDWSMLVQVDDAMDILPLTATKNGLHIVLTAEQLSISGYYNLQLRGTQGDLVKHTNIVNAYVPSSISGDKQWPVVPSEFTELEKRVRGYSANPPVIGENGNWWAWDGTRYTDTGKPSVGEGEPGEPGPAGPTGPAYELTAEDKNELVDAVLAALPSAERRLY